MSDLYIPHAKELPMLEETTILNQAKKGDQKAITCLVMNYQHIVRSYLYAMTPDPHTGDDLAQEVFVKFIRSIDRIDPEKGIKSYLLTIARNMVIDYWRKIDRRKKKHHEILFGDLERCYETTIKDKEPHTLRLKLKLLKKCLKTLNPRLYPIIEGFYYENLKCRELAIRAKTSECNIRAMLYRGRKALFRCITKQIRKSESDI